jgi:hypothetical protein
MTEIAPTIIDPALASRLGQIVISWATAESWLSHLLATLVDADPGGLAILTSTAGAATQIQWIHAAIGVFQHQSDLTEVSDLIKHADDLRKDRNAVAHGIWDPTGCAPGTCLVTTYNWRQSEISKACLITTSDLDELLDGIHEWIRDYVRVGKKFNFPRRKGEALSIFLD